MRKVSLSVADDHMDRFPQVVEDAKAAGLDVGEELELIGVVNGSIDDERVEELRHVPGVAYVEEERIFEIPPPDSTIQSLPEEGDDFAVEPRGEAPSSTSEAD